MGSQSELNAAGRVLNKKNSSSLLDAFKTLADVLGAASLLDAEKLAQALEESTEAESEPVAAASSNRKSESLKDQVNRITWHKHLKTAMNVFIKRFADTHDLTDAELTSEYGDVDRQKEIQSLTSDFSSILGELVKSHPGVVDDWSVRWKGSECYLSEHPFMLSALSAGAIQDETIPEIQIPVNRVSVSFSCSAATSKTKTRSTAKPKMGNRSPFKGVLFRVDEPSEAIPAKGPGLPLYIPQSVALSLQGKVAGLPLDAADNLSSHDDENIVGVMMSASIEGSDFVVEGQLWPNSRAAKVQSIAAARDELGMSLTGDAIGHHAEVDGRQVFWVDALELKGANILYSEKATFQKTRLIEASGVSAADLEADSHIAAAATYNSDSLGDNPMSDALIKQLADQIKSSLEAVAGVGKAVEDISTRLEVIEGERSSRQSELAAAAAQEERDAAHKKLMDEVADTVKQTLAKALGGNQPRRVAVMPLSASGADPNSNEKHQVELKLASLQGELNGQPDLARQSQILDEMRALQAGLNSY